MSPRWPTGEVLDGLWRFESVHPDWSDDNDGWDPEVAWWAVATQAGLVLVDPLLQDRDRQALDGLVEAAGGCAGIVRTTLWHERSIPELAERYHAEVWAGRPPEGAPPLVLHHVLEPEASAIRVLQRPLPSGLVAHFMPRQDEIALWLPKQRALLFGDVVIRDPDGRLRTCPDAWLHADDGPRRLRAALTELLGLPIEHALVAHGPPILRDGATALAAATRAEPASQAGGA
jgi:hypothetical protein